MLCAAGFGLRYCVERYCDLRIYRKPPLYSKELVGSYNKCEPTQQNKTKTALVLK
jgi:hypothetical protein